MLTHSFYTASLALLATASTVLASPLYVRSGYSIKNAHNVPRGWSNIGAAPPEHVINLRIALKQHNVGELERQLQEGMQHLCIL